MKSCYRVFKGHGFLVFALTILIILGGTKGQATPLFSRETNLPCSSCHNHIPRLNIFGQKFFANGYKIGHTQTYAGLPFWTNYDMAASVADGKKIVSIDFTDTHYGSQGRVGGNGAIYGFELHPSTNEFNVWAIQPLSARTTIQVGQFSPLSQFDRELDISLSAPVSAFPFDATGLESVGPFGPGDAATGARFSFAERNALPYANGWNLSATVPFSTGDGESEFRRPSLISKGLYVQAYRRFGLDSFGISGFAGRDGRHYYGALGQKQLGKIYIQGGASSVNWSGRTAAAYSLGADYISSFNFAAGFRVDDMAGDCAYVPYLSFVSARGTTAYKFVFESRLQSRTFPGTTVSFSFKF